MSIITPQPTEQDSWRDTEKALDPSDGTVPADALRPWLWPPRAKVAPIRLPDPVLASRAFEARQRIERDVEAARIERELRHHHAIAAATSSGRQVGLREGYTQGWHWGLWCGVVLGGLLCVGMAFCAVLLRTSGVA